MLIKCYIEFIKRSDIIYYLLNVLYYNRYILNLIVNKDIITYKYSKRKVSYKTKQFTNLAFLIFSSMT